MLILDHPAYFAIPALRNASILQEPWLIGVLSFQVLLLVITIAFRNSIYFSAALMAVSGELK